MADLFEQIKQIYRKDKVEGSVNTTVLHRFFASEITLASAAKEISQLYDDEMIVAMWLASLPKTPNPPRFKYASPKKAPEVEELVERVATAEGYTLFEAAEVVEMMTTHGLRDAALTYYGVEVKEKKK